jgi:hypothetical protein
MQKEFNSDKAYSDEKFLHNVWGEEESREDLIDSLAWRDKEPQAPLKYWMTFPAHGYLIADTYQRPVILLSEEMPTTYLPLSHIPNNNPLICLILLPEYPHFIKFTFKAKIWPCPRIDPFWKFYVSDEARGWEDWIQPNIERIMKSCTHLSEDLCTSKRLLLNLINFFPLLFSVPSSDFLLVSLFSF